MKPWHPLLFSEEIHNPVLRQNLPLRRKIREWCEIRAAELSRQNSAPLESKKMAVGVSNCVHVFVDDSNLVVGAPAGRLVNIGKLVQIVHQSRKVMEKVVVGSGSTPTKSAHWQRWKQAGYAVMNDPRRGREVFVDEALLSQLGKTAARTYQPPRVLALVTGDGNRNQGRASFPDHLQTALLHGWHVELYSWKRSVHSCYSKFADEYGEKFKVIHLDGRAVDQQE